MANHHKHGLQHDLSLIATRSLSRRRLLGWGVGAGLVTLIGCPQDGGLGSAASTAAKSGASSSGSSSGSCTRIPEETGGPYPADGSNGVNALTLSGIVRSDIRASFGGASGVAAGVPLTVTLNLVDIADSCSPATGCAVYLWHCDRAGNYSLYSSAVIGENYLRGVQEADDLGQVTFQTIFPGCYSGRWPHIHFEVYESLEAATSATNKLVTSQLALPEATCQLVYATSGYESSVKNLAQISLASDNVFSDGWTTQTPSVTGDASSGFHASLSVGVPVSG
jgi:protocatechuate 3,4-dioxygenase beta subunit